MSKLVRHLVKNPKVLIEIQNLKISKQEKEKLTEMAILIYHQKLLNRILDYLEEQDKELFLELFFSGEDQTYLQFLHEKIMDLENIIEVAILEIEGQILTDIKELAQGKQ